MMTDLRPDVHSGTVNGHAIANPEPNVWVIRPCAEEYDPWAEAESEELQPSSWLQVDLSTALSRELVSPELGRREDNVYLLYRGRVHWVYGAYESGKTWLCLYFVAQVLLDGGTALYVDFEDNEHSTSVRLLQLGVPEPVITDPSRFVYVRPDEPLNRQAFEHILSRTFDVAVLDGVTESMALENLKDGLGGDVAIWQAMLPRAIKNRTGAAVLCIDHVPKAENNRVMPIGNQHKMSGLDGAAFKIVRGQPFGRGNIGTAFVHVSKDRHGAVRGIGVNYDAKDNSHLVGVFSLDAQLDPFAVSARVAAPGDGSVISRTSGKRHTWCMEQLSIYLEGDLDARDRSSNKAIDHGWKSVLSANGKQLPRDTWRDALSTLVDEKWVVQQPGSNKALLHTVATPYREDEDPKSDGSTDKALRKRNRRRAAEIERAYAQKALDEADRELVELSGCAKPVELDGRGQK